MQKNDEEGCNKCIILDDHDKHYTTKHDTTNRRQKNWSWTFCGVSFSFSTTRELLFSSSFRSLL